MKKHIDNKKDNTVNQLNTKKKKNFKSQSKNNKEEINHINLGEIMRDKICEFF